MLIVPCLSVKHNHTRPFAATSVLRDACMALLKAARKNKAKPYRQAKLYHLRLSPAAKAGDNHKFFQKAPYPSQGTDF